MFTRFFSKFARSDESTPKQQPTPAQEADSLPDDIFPVNWPYYVLETRYYSKTTHLHYVKRNGTFEPLPPCPAMAQAA